MLKGIKKSYRKSHWGTITKHWLDFLGNPECCPLDVLVILIEKDGRPVSEENQLIENQILAMQPNIEQMRFFGNSSSYL